MNRLKLSLEIYSISNIEKTCRVYKDYAKIRISKKESEVEVLFDNCKYDSWLTIKEFENYLIVVENR